MPAVKIPEAMVLSFSVRLEMFGAKWPDHIIRQRARRVYTRENKKWIPIGWMVIAPDSSKLDSFQERRIIEFDYRYE